MVMERIMWPLPNLMTTLSASLGVVYATIGESHVRVLIGKAQTSRFICGAMSWGWGFLIQGLLMPWVVMWPFCLSPVLYLSLHSCLCPFPTISVPLPYHFCTLPVPLALPLPVTSFISNGLSCWIFLLDLCLSPVWSSVCLLSVPLFTPDCTHPHHHLYPTPNCHLYPSHGPSFPSSWQSL